MTSNISISSRSMIFAIVMAIGFLTLVASKIALGIHRTETDQLDQQASRQDRNTAGTTAVANPNSKHKYINNAGYFTSMEAEFEWNQFMVPDYEPDRIDHARLIERERDTGRRLLEGDVLRYGILRGMRNGD